MRMIVLALAALGAWDDDERAATVGGVRYEAVDRDIPARGESPALRRASIRAVEVETGRELWTATVNEMDEPVDPEWRADASLGRIVELHPIEGRGLLVRVGGRPHALFDPESRESRLLPDERRRALHCELHGTTLRDDVVKIVYGLINTSAEEHRARQTLFPHANTETWGGCIVSRSLTLALVRFCPDCREARAGWWGSR